MAEVVSDDDFGISSSAACMAYARFVLAGKCFVEGREPARVGQSQESRELSVLLCCFR